MEIGGLLILLMFFGVVCCLFYTRRYFTPILEDIDHVTAAGGEARKPFLRRTSAPFRQDCVSMSGPSRIWKRSGQDLRGQMEQAEANAKRLAQRRKSEIDPEEYQLFLSAYQKLGPEARTVIDAMVDGISVQVLAEQLGKKMSTVYSYRQGYLWKSRVFKVKTSSSSSVIRVCAHAAGANRIRRFPRPL